VPTVRNKYVAHVAARNSDGIAKLQQRSSEFLVVHNGEAAECTHVGAILLEDLRFRMYVIHFAHRDAKLYAATH